MKSISPFGECVAIKEVFEISQAYLSSNNSTVKKEREKLSILIYLGVIKSEFWEILISLNCPFILKAIAFRTFPKARKNAPITVFVSYRDKKPYRICQLNIQDSQSALEYFASYNIVAVRCFVAGNPETPLKVLAGLAQDDNQRVKKMASLNLERLLDNIKNRENDSPDEGMINTSSDINGLIYALNMILENDQPIRLKVQEEKYSKILEWLINREISKAISLKNKPTPIIFLKANLFKDNELIETAINSHAPWELLAFLAQTQNEKIHQALFLNPNMPDVVLEAFAKSENFKFRSYVARNSNVSTTIQGELADAKFAKVREALAENIQTSTDLLEVLGDDEDVNARYADTKNSKTPEELIEKPMQDAKIINLYLHLLQTEGIHHYDVHIAVAKDHQTPMLILRYLANCPSPIVRKVVAENSQTSKLDLELLAKDNYEGVLFAVAMNRQTPGRVLEQLAVRRLSHHIRKAIAANSQTPGSTLELLTEDNEEAILSLVAKNPNTPISTLERLAESCSFYVRKAVAGNIQSPSAVLEKLAKDKDLDVRIAIAYNQQTPTSVLKRFAVSRLIYIRKAVAKNSQTPSSILERLSEDIDETVLIGIASNLSASASILEKLANSGSTYVREVIARNIQTPSSVLEALAKNSEENIRYAVAINPQTPVSVLKRLAVSSLIDIRKAVAKNNQTPSSILERLSEDTDETVLIVVASNLNAPVMALERLAGSRSIHIRKAVAENRQTLSAVLEKLSNDLSWSVRLSVADNTQTPKSTKDRLENDTNFFMYKFLQKIDREVRIAFIKTIKSGDLLDQLSNDGFATVRSAVGENPNIPDFLLEKLATDESPTVRAALAFNVNTPEAILKHLISDTKTNVRTAAIRQLGNSINLDQFAHDSSPSIRQIVAENELTSLSLLNNLSSDTDSTVKYSAIKTLIKYASNPEISLETLEILAESKYPDIREEVARNQQASIDILERLLFDKDCKVFIAAIENPNTPGKAIEMRAVKFIQELCDPGRSSDFSRFFCLLDIRAPLYLLEKYSGAQSWLSRFAVAKNPSTSLEILKILTQDKHPVVKKTAQEHMRVFEN